MLQLLAGQEGGRVIQTPQRNVALLVAGRFFMEMLAGTVVVTASPQIGRSLHAPATEIGLLVTAYLLTLAVLIPLSGSLTRRLGNRAVFLTAIAVFTLASAGCAASGGAARQPVGCFFQRVCADDRGPGGHADRGARVRHLPRLTAKMCFALAGRTCRPNRGMM